MEKPTKYPVEPEYDYNEVIDYIEEKYGALPTDSGYSFWHFIVDHCEVRNDSSCTLYWWQIENDRTPPFVRKIADMLDNEGFFDLDSGDDRKFKFYVSW